MAFTVFVSSTWEDLQVSVLLDVYRHQRIVLYLDAFEHNLDADGEIHSLTLRSFVESFLASDHPSKLLLTTRQRPTLSAREVGLIEQVPLDDGLPDPDAVFLLRCQLPAGQAPSAERLESVVRAVSGIPFAVERLAHMLRRNPLLDLGTLAAREDALDEFVRLAHSSLSQHASLTLQARAVFEEHVNADALAFVLRPELDADEVEAGIAELGRGGFLFPLDDGRLGIHEYDRESSYRALERGGALDRRAVHRRAADYYAGRCFDREHWFDWTSYEELKGDIQRFRHLVRAGEPVAAARSMNVGKLEFLNWMGHVDRVQGMFADLNVEEDATASLIRRFALADALVVVGPFDRAVIELNEVIEQARSLGDVTVELTATYEIGLAYRYAGEPERAVHAMRSTIERIRERGDERWAAYDLYGYSLACAYAGDQVEAIRAGREQVRYGRSVGNSYFVARGNSSLCLPYFLIGRIADAARCARDSAAEFVNTRHEYLVGFIENVQGLALHAQGDVDAALQAFERASAIGRRTLQRRAEGLAATNRAWVLYERGDLVAAVSSVIAAIRIFDDISQVDARLVGHLRTAFEYAGDGDRQEEAGALCEFVRSAYVNPDLVARTTVAARLLALGTAVESAARQEIESFMARERESIDRVVATLG